METRMQVPDDVTLDDLDHVTIDTVYSPDVGANRRQIPRDYRQLSQLVRPLRVRFPEGQSFIRPGGGRSGAEATNEWLARFD